VPLRDLRYPLVSFFIFIAALALPGSTAAGPGRLDLTFALNFDHNSLVEVRVIEPQADGKLIVAGNFKIVNETRRDIIRLNANNTIDTTFNAGTALGTNGGSILAVKIQPDGKILVGGTFNNFNGSFVPRLIRLNSDGSVDQTFSLTGLDVTFVFDIDLQSNGKILISASNLIGSSFIARFSTTGAWDNTFTFAFFGGSGFTIDVTSEDKVFLGGWFMYTIGANQGRNLARLGADGAVDNTFIADVAASGFPSVHVQEITGGRLLIWGRFDFVNGLPRRGVAIVNGDGSTDTQFDPSAIQVETIRSAEYQTDGKVLIAGENFTRTNTRLRGNIARFNSDGSIDTTFFQGRGVNGAVRVIRLRGPNRLLIGGDFVRYDRLIRRYLAQIHV
jgi:uncharacterized delta-60 repeat protein